MVNIRIVKNIDISYPDLLDICKIKSVFGNYSLKSQLQWIKDYVRPNDLHFLIYEQDELVAYSCLVSRILFINESPNFFLGLSAVCVSKEGTGKGEVLMSHINNYLNKTKSIGLLFCKSSLLSFYSKFQWKEIKPIFKKDVFWFIYGLDDLEAVSIQYKDEIF